MNFDTTLNPNTAKILVGNKCDLENERKVTRVEGKEFGTKYNMEFFEASSLTGTNIKDIVIKTTKIMIQNYQKYPSKEMYF